MPERALLSHVSWMDYCRAKIRVGKKKQEASYDPQCNTWSKCRLAVCHHRVPGRDHHRHYNWRQHCATSYVLSLGTRG